MRPASATIALVRLGVGYPGSARLDHARRDMDAMASARVSVVILDASEEDAFERAGHVAALVAEARERGLEVRVAPRGVLGLFAGGGASVALARDPSIRQRLSDGTAVPAACPNDPGTGSWLERWLVAALGTRPDAIAWAEPRLWVAARDPWRAGRRDAWACACDTCASAWGHGRHDAPGGAMPSAFTLEVRDFRRRSLIGLLEPGLALARRAGVRNVLTVAPATGDHPEALPWEDLVSLAYVDGLGTDACDSIDASAPDDASFWAARVVRVVRATRGRAASHVRFRLDGIRPGHEEHLVAAVAAATSAGIDEVVVRAWPEADAPRAAGAPVGSGGPSSTVPATIPADEAWRLLADAVRAAP
jgi:hypothetical protein